MLIGVLAFACLGINAQSARSHVHSSCRACLIPFNSSPSCNRQRQTSARGVLMAALLSLSAHVLQGLHPGSRARASNRRPDLLLNPPEARDRGNDFTWFPTLATSANTGSVARVARGLNRTSCSVSDSSSACTHDSTCWSPHPNLWPSRFSTRPSRSGVITSPDGLAGDFYADLRWHAQRMLLR